MHLSSLSSLSLPAREERCVDDKKSIFCSSIVFEAFIHTVFESLKKSRIFTTVRANFVKIVNFEKNVNFEEKCEF